MFVFKKRSLIVISMILLTIFTFVICFGAISRLKVGEATSTGLKVVLDAGHGGVDPGVVGRITGVRESDINLSIVKKVKRLLESAGISVILTRSTDAGLYGLATKNLKRKDMQKRKEIIEKANANLVVSIHLNSFSSSSKRGAQVYYNKDSDLSYNVGQNVTKALKQIECLSSACSLLKGDYYILNCTSTPSIICECGFLSNYEDEQILLTEPYQQELSYAIYYGIINYFAEQTTINSKNI